MFVVMFRLINCGYPRAIKSNTKLFNRTVAKKNEVKNIVNMNRIKMKSKMNRKNILKRTRY